MRAERSGRNRPSRRSRRFGTELAQTRQRGLTPGTSAAAMPTSIDRDEAAVQVQRPHARRLLGHRRAGDRLLRPLLPVHRPRARRVPPQARPARDGGRRAGRRVRHARVHDRVRTRRRSSTTSSRSSSASRASAARARPTRPPHTARATTSSWSRRRRRSCSSTSTSARRARSPNASASTIADFEGDDVSL